MNATLVPPIPGAGSLHQRRCVRHSGREAAARCPGCREFFCRECVVEHDGKLLCAPCLAKLAAFEGNSGQRLAKAGRIGRAVIGVLALWLMFYALGAVLLKVPPQVHDGTVRENPPGDSPP